MLDLQEQDTPPARYLHALEVEPAPAPNHEPMFPELGDFVEFPDATDTFEFPEAPVIKAGPKRGFKAVLESLRLAGRQTRALGRLAMLDLDGARERLAPPQAEAYDFTPSLKDRIRQSAYEDMWQTHPRRMQRQENKQLRALRRAQRKADKLRYRRQRMEQLKFNLGIYSVGLASAAGVGFESVRLLH